MNTTTLAGCACATVVAAAIGTVLAQEPAFRSGVDAVRVDVLVTDRRGAPMSRLELGDFELRDNGVPQHVAEVSYGTMPVSIVLALDTSASVEGEPLERLVEAAQAMLAHTGDGDSATLVAFSHSIVLEHAVNGEIRGIEAVLRRMRAGGLTSFHDATWMALMRADRPGMRSLVVVFSDGKDNRSWLAPASVLHAARSVNATVYGVRVRPAPRPGGSAGGGLTPARHSDMADGFLEQIASESGGRVLLADTSRDIRPALVTALREFRQRYLLTYFPERVSPAGWHRVEVAVKRRGAKVTARRGYQRNWPAP